MKKTFLPLVLLLLAACTSRVQTNLALYKAAYASSNYDHNLTAQLVTDGIKSSDAPAYLEVVTSEGVVDRVEREATLDHDMWSRNPINGDCGWIEYHFHGYTVMADKAIVLFQEALPGGRGGTPFTMELPVTLGEDGSLRIDFVLPRKARWRVKNVDFYNNGVLQNDLLPASHFTSAWMSESVDNEWVMVDLGRIYRIDSVRFGCLQCKVERASLELSRDGILWKNVGTFPDSETGEYLLSRRCKGRYVRLNLHADSLSCGHLFVSELEVFGPSSTKKTESNWQLMRASQVDATGEQISMPDFKTVNWLPAVVPGTVLNSYIKAGAVPDPEYADDVRHISDSYFCSDFWYRWEFDSADFFADGNSAWRRFLDFDGINWKAEVYMNGQRLDNIEGAFIRGHMDVTDLLRDGTNAVAVRIINNANPGCVKEKTAKWTGYNGGVIGLDSPSFLASIGWDWFTTVRGRNCGIWNDVRLVQKGQLELSDPLVVTKLSEEGLASMTVSVKLAGDLPEDGMARLEGHIGDIHFNKLVSECGEISFTPEEFPQLNRQSMELWWPNGYGEPYLYDAGFTVETSTGLSDSIEYKAGIREVSCTGLSDTLRLIVNGRRVNPMGGNWGFSQLNLDYSAEQYEIAISYHQQMHFNMIRNWVGQIGDEEFYESCDRHGIMVWQDFWLANPSDGPNPADEQMFLKNASDMVSKIRRHPSIVLYCGRNEGFPPESLDKALREDVVSCIHPDIPYISSSADVCVSGHGPYEAKNPEYYYAHQSGKLHSERGVPVIATYESLCRMMPREDRWPVGEMWGKHDFTRDGAQRNITYKAMMNDAFGECASAEEFTALAQWVNYECNRAIFESANANGRNGVLLWMSHAAWPSLVYCTYDYYFEPTGAFFGSKKACEPLHIQYNPLTSQVDVVNNCAPQQDSLCAEMRVFSRRGVFLSGNIAAGLKCPVDSLLHCFKVDAPEGEDVYYLDMSLRDGDGNLVSNNFYMLGNTPGNLQSLRDLPSAKISKTVHVMGNMARVQLRNDSDVPALLVRLILKDSNGEEILPVDYSDNYIALMPGEAKSIVIRWEGNHGVKVEFTQLGDYRSR